MSLFSILGKLPSSVLLSLAREEEMLLFSILGKFPSSVLLSLAREEDLSVRGLFSTVSDFLSRAREMSSLSCFCSTGIIMSKLLSVFRSTSTVGIDDHVH